MAQTNGPMTLEVAFGPFRLLGTERLLLRYGQPVEIGDRALDILIALVSKAGEVVTRRDLMEWAWPGVIVDETNVRVQVSALRKALREGQDGARYIANVAGRGYCFVAPIKHIAADPVPARATATLAQPTRRLSLPPRLSTMVGRDEAVGTVSSLLQATRFVSIVGAGGMGKTTVAVAAAHDLATAFGGAVHFVDLGMVQDVSLVGTAMASAVGCLAQAQDPIEAILSFVGDERMLVVLDNCEHLIDGAAAAAERLIKGAPQLHVLTTSREALRADGENVYLLAPLEGPEETASLTAVEALASPAIQLFMERAAASGHRVPLSDADAPTVAQICYRLDGIPLAIELAAGRVGMHGLRGTADLLDHRFRLLWHGRRTALPRHQTLHAMLDWSFNLLTEPEQETLCRLSVFVGAFTLDGAMSVTASAKAELPDAASLIESLVAKSLVWVSHGNGAAYYRLPDATRAYAAEKLAQRGKADETSARHAEYCARCIRERPRMPRALVTPDPPSIDDVRVALVWCFSETGDVGIGIDLALQSVPLLLHLSLLGECERWAERALSALPDSDRGTGRELTLLEALAISSMFTRGNSDEIRVSLERGLALAEALGDSQRELHLLAGLNIFATRIGDFRWALSVAQRSIEVADKLDDPIVTAMTEWMVGVSQHLIGDQAAAQHHCERGLEIDAAEGLGDVQFFGYDHRVRALVALARALWLRGLPERAVKVAHRAIEEATARDHPIDVCISYIYTIPVFLWIGDLARAEEHVEQLIAYAGKHSLGPYRAVGDALKGEILLRQGDAAAGASLLRGALAVLNSDRHRILIPTFSRALAEALAGVGELADALETVRSAASAAVARGGTFELPDLHRAEGQILLSAPQPDVAAAEQALTSAIDCARHQSALGWELRAAIPLARLWSQQGRAGEAHAMLDGLLRQFREGFDTADLIAAETLRHELAGSRSP